MNLPVPPLDLSRVAPTHNVVMERFLTPALQVMHSTERIHLKEPCPVCMRDKFRMAITTNCGHVFCVTCLFKYYNKNRLDRYGFTKCVGCPMCRAPMSVLTKNPVTARNLPLPLYSTSLRKVEQNLLPPSLSPNDLDAQS